MLKKFLFLGAAALAMTATSTIAADSSRVRLMIPVQATYNGEALGGSSSSVDSASPSGYNINYVHSTGFGLGYTSSDLKTTEKSGGTTTDYQLGAATFIDISYTFGVEITGQVVLGFLTGQGDLETSGTTYSASEKEGNAIGINGGYDFGGFEALLGYRSETVKATLSGGTTEYDLSRSLISAGIGFTF